VTANQDGRPLADRMRPRTLEEFAGQGHLVGAGAPLARAVAGAGLHSMVLWGPPGSGKTTLARLIASQYAAEFIALSAVLAGVKDVRAAVERAQAFKAEGRRTVLFLDEVHRFNKAQQDAFLPWVEDGTLTFIGATTENPSFELNSALLSRARVYVLKALSREALLAILRQALADPERGLGNRAPALAPEQLEALADAADGDARRALNLLELAADLAEETAAGVRALDEATLAGLLAGGHRRFDKRGEAFYDQISALHKSVRGTDPDAALYWLARMLDGGCDPAYIARRILRMASEDIGNADPRGPRAGARRLGCLRAARQPGGRARPRAGGGLPRLRAEEQRRLPGVRRGAGGRGPARLAARPAAPAQRADQAHAGPRLRARLPLRA
jgi:putative ATPase